MTNFSTLSRHDAKQIALQRTARLISFPIVGSPAYRAWARGFHGLMDVEASIRRKSILEGAMREIAAEFSVVSKYLTNKGIHPRKSIDIGCGHAFADLLLYQEFQTDLHLIDVEATDATHHDYHDTGAGYASLVAAKRFLEINGVPSEKITLTNPAKSPPVDADVDLILSMISCGFHYPLKTYLDFARKTLAPSGCFIFDLRKGSGQEHDLAAFSHVELVCDEPKYQRLAGFF